MLSFGYLKVKYSEMLRAKESKLARDSRGTLDRTLGLGALR